MGQHQKIARERWATIKELRDKGVTVKEIATLCGVSNTRISQILARMARNPASAEVKPPATPEQMLKSLMGKVARREVRIRNLEETIAALEAILANECQEAKRWRRKAEEAAEYYRRVRFDVERDMTQMLIDRIVKYLRVCPKHHDIADEVHNHLTDVLGSYL